MQGLWKEKISGWNHKDTKRKKWTRKHYIKEKGKFYLKEFDIYSDRSHKNLTYGKELEVITDITPSVVPTHANVYNALIKYPDKVVTYYINGIPWSRTQHNTVNCLIYEFKSSSYMIKRRFVALPDSYLIYEDFAKDLPIPAWLDNYEVIQMTPTYIVKDLSEVIINKQYFRKRRNVSTTFNSYNNKMFLFNKPVSWKADLNILYNDGKRRKMGQNIANSADRALLRAWIGKADWDREIGVHGLSKSIAWFVH